MLKKMCSQVENEIGRQRGRTRSRAGKAGEWAGWPRASTRVLCVREWKWKGIKFQRIPSSGA